jgi:hypothetical protein
MQLLVLVNHVLRGVTFGTNKKRGSIYIKFSMTGQEKDGL